MIININEAKAQSTTIGTRKLVYSITHSKRKLIGNGVREGGRAKGRLDNGKINRARKLLRAMTVYLVKREV